MQRQYERTSAHSSYALQSCSASSHQIGVSNCIQLEMGTSDFGFLQTYVLSELWSVVYA